MIHPQRILRRPGIVLVEALVAISTLAMGVMALGTITQNAIGTTVLAKDYLVARGLAKEGEEAVKSIRYTNWMLKPSDDSCWLNIVPTGTCSSAAVGSYIVSLNNGAWKMEIKSPELNLNSNTTSDYTPYQLYTGSNGSYSSTSNGNTASRFYRSVKFTNVDDFAKSYASATFTVKVQWKDGAKTQEVNRTLTMYNYR